MVGTKIKPIDSSVQSGHMAVEPTMVSLDYSIHLEGDVDRKAVERYIAARYFDIHGAYLSDYSPLLIQISSSSSLKAAVGLRSGGDNPLFLEQYLDTPIEQQVAALFKCPVDRSSVMEVGNLVVTGRGLTRVLMVVLVAALFESDYGWMTFTVTCQLERILKQMGFHLVYLAGANPDRLEGDKSIWGTYYANQPRVMLASTSAAMAVIESNPQLCKLLHQYGSMIRDIARTLIDQRRYKHGVKWAS